MKFFFLGVISYLFFLFFSSAFTIYSLLYVLLIYLSIFFILINFGFDFIALFLIIVYVGGILVLFLFTLFFFENSRSLYNQFNEEFFKFSFFFKCFLLIFLIIFFFLNSVYFNNYIYISDLFRFFIIKNFTCLNFVSFDFKEDNPFSIFYNFS